MLIFSEYIIKKAGKEPDLFIFYLFISFILVRPKIQSVETF